MCGITGIINKKSVITDQIELRRMNELIAHRGPDGEGFYVDGHVGLGHRRLAIIDLSQDGHQPMIYSDDSVITFNGEIYNYIEVREDLIKLGITFKTKSDTEVILAAYKQWGQECVKRFNGMWSFAIHDKVRDILFCSRDRFGVKPFYYYDNNELFKFGSEIKQLLNPTGPNKANKDLIAHYLFTGMHDHENRTFFDGILKLPPSHNLIYDLKSQTFSIHQFYTIPNKPETTDYSEKLIDGIKLRLRSDVKVGTCLSGGVDSSTIAAIASKLYTEGSSEKFNAIHAKSIEKATDESHYAIEVANHSNLELHVIEPHAADFVKYLDEVIYTQEEPFGSPSIYMQYFVMKKARDINCKVMLDGQGGDETLLGYERYYAPAYASIFKDQGFMKMIQEVLLSKKNNTKMGFINIGKYLAGTFLLKIRYLHLKRKFGFLKTEHLPLDIKYWSTIRSHAFDLFSLQVTELFSTNLQALLRYEDKNSMRHGIETRLPFMDYKTVESALNLPIQNKIHQGWTKYILRTICGKFLPRSIAWRKSKLGFNAPDGSWLNELGPETFEEVKNSKLLNTLIDKSKWNQLPWDNLQMRWRLINLVIWERLYKAYI